MQDRIGTAMGWTVHVSLGALLDAIVMIPRTDLDLQNGDYVCMAGDYEIIFMAIIWLGSRCGVRWRPWRWLSWLWLYTYVVARDWH